MSKNMAKENFLAVVSTYATDRTIYEKSGKIEETPGGPILFIKNALEKLGLQPEIFSGEQMLVEILVKENDEFGKINEPKNKSPLPKISSKSAIISTLLDEWNLTNAGDYRGKLFVDLQGYVRDGSAFGKKKAWNDVRAIVPHIFCLKGNDVEMSYIPNDVLENQKNRMLIITKDKNGVDIFFKNRAYSFTPERIIKPKHTIGAGDTFFANFVYQFLKTANIQESATFAINKTSDFLSEIK
jgi:hypothetical protein